jgi:hypothetical protein
LCTTKKSRKLLYFSASNRQNNNHDDIFLIEKLIWKSLLLREFIPPKICKKSPFLGKLFSLNQIESHEMQILNFNKFISSLEVPLRHSHKEMENTKLPTNGIVQEFHFVLNAQITFNIY